MNFPVIPARMALINVDMQNCFVQNSRIAASDGLALLQRINQLASVCRAAGILVIHTSHVLRPDGSNMGMLAELAAVKAGMIHKGSVSADLHKELVVDHTDILLDKPRFGAFYGTDLDLILRARGIDTVIIAGIATNVCCETTAREAMVRDFRVFFLSDGTTTFGMSDATAAELQKATLATLSFVFGHILSTDEMIEKIQRATATGA
jgi:nicotinamidase-related amidase